MRDLVFAGGVIGTVAALAGWTLWSSATRLRREAQAGQKRTPAWEWFAFANVLAAAIFVAAVGYLASARWSSAATSAATLIAAAVAQPGVGLAMLAAAASALYLVAFCGVAFIHSDVDDALAPRKREHTVPPAPSAGSAAAAGAPTAAAAAARPLRPEYDADVVIVGAGTAGAALATVLARDGKRVVVIERNMAMVDRIVGELMQPGGVRALERMGLDACAKASTVDPVEVDGYVCITPHSSPSADLILSYPLHDPATLGEHFGLVAGDGRTVKRHARHRGGDAAGGDSPVAASDAGAGAGAGDAPGSPRAGLAAVTTEQFAADEAPHGRSFHNHRFVHQLRLAALAEPNVTLHLGRVTALVTAGQLAGSSAVALEAARTSKLAAPVFAGYNDAGVPQGSKAAPPLRTPPAGGSPAPSHPLATPDDAIGGVKWVDEAGVEHVVSARLTVVADGMYSVLRKELHRNEPHTVSHFCGLLLHHPPHETPLPYPHRGHVVMADPNPVLLYQISATETRVLVDVPGKLPSQEDGSLRRHFLDIVAPQLPAVVRRHFVEAASTQEAVCMPNKSLVAAPVQRHGAVLLGDSWNMRHPLTGGGMTVALKDAEMLANALAPLDLQRASWSEVDDALRRFQSRRSAHASTINVLANALHRVFTRPEGDDGRRDRLRAACIDYLSLGGAPTAGPVGLLSGLTPRPGVLVTHFFAVAAHAMRAAVLPFPTPSRLRRGYDLLHVACVIILPLLEAEGVTILASRPLLALTNALFPWRNAQCK